MSLVKYPRTYHFSYSPGVKNDDRIVEDDNMFDGQKVVATIKMDGENTSIYSDHIHARSLDSGRHPSRNYVKKLQGEIGYKIPKGWRFCGENLFAKHSIHYKHLPDYFMLFSIWDENNVCLSWDDTALFAQELSLHVVPLIYRGIFDKEKILGAFKTYEETSDDDVEGFVVRTVEEFPYPTEEFLNRVAKYVRSGHVQTDKMWMYQPVIPNELNI